MGCYSITSWSSYNRVYHVYVEYVIISKDTKSRVDNAGQMYC